jgi:hypothetical protein
VGLSRRPRTQAYETTNETAAEVRGMTSVSLAREILADPDARPVCAPEPVAPRQVRGRHQLTQMASHGVIGKFEENVRRPAVISSPLSGVSAVTAEGVFVCIFAARWTRYLYTVSAAEPRLIPLSLLSLELNSYYVNVVQLHVYAADVMASHGVDRDDFR